MKIFFKALYKYWMKFAHLLGTVNGFILLTIFYFVLIGLYALPYAIVRLTLHKRQGKPDSYWQEKSDGGDTLESVRYQF